MATKKSVGAAAMKKTVAKPKKPKKLAGVMSGFAADCEECTWGFEAAFDTSLMKKRELKAEISIMKGSDGKALMAKSGAPVFKIKLSEMA